MTMRFICAPLLYVALAAASATAQQLPAGTRDATDNSRVEAASARLREAEATLERGDFAAAVTRLQKLAADQPKNAHILYDFGYAQERTGAESQAAASYSAAIAADPAFADPRLALGLLDARSGHMEKAHSELAAAAQMSDAAPEMRARAYRALARIDEETQPSIASDELLAAIKLSGETPDDTALSAALAARSGDASSAEAAYRRVLAQHPEDPDAAAGLAHVLLSLKRPAEAEEVLTAPLKAHPDDPRLLSQMASLLAVEGKVDQAIPMLEKLRTNPKIAADPAVARQLARLYQMNGQQTQAEQLFTLALQASPGDPTLMDDLGGVLISEQKYSEAERMFAQAVSHRDQFPSRDAFGDAAGHLAFAASKAGHPDLCLKALALRATVQANSAPSLFLEATAHDSLHQYKEAIRAYQAFLAIAKGQYPDQEFEARHRLLALEHMK